MGPRIGELDGHGEQVGAMMSTELDPGTAVPARTSLDVMGRVIELSRPLDLRQTLGPMQRGASDPSMRIRGDEVVRATRTPVGPASLWLSYSPVRGQVSARAWGAGAGWAIDRLPDLLGEQDDPAPLLGIIESSGLPERRLLRDLCRTMPGLRIPRSGQIFEALLPTIIEQRVTGAEARRSYRDLVLALGEPAPGPSELFGRLMVPPSPTTLSATPYWDFHRLGIELKRARTIVGAGRQAARFDRLVDLAPVEARRVLLSLAGVGEWTAAEVALIALGDADAVSVGDYHIPHQITWAFTGKPRGNDQTMLELLEPYRGQRGRVIRLIQAAGITAPRFGPRREVSPFRNR